MFILEIRQIKGGQRERECVSERGERERERKRESDVKGVYIEEVTFVWQLT